MNIASHDRILRLLLPVILLGTAASTYAQVPVDEDGTPIGEYESAAGEFVTGDENIPLLSSYELQELVGPVALYPDDLLAIVLPASTYPLQIVQAGRFLEELETNPGAEPDPSWDDSVVALLNYPEVVDLLNEDLDWTWRLGEAVVAQQTDVVTAVESFRDRAYAAGNLRSDDRQTVAQADGIIEITPVRDDIIYVPYYEPERVVVYQPRPVYYYYPRPYPVYYYPYPASHAFNRGYFWGVTTAFTVGWYSDSLRVFHHSYSGHPYYGISYWDRWWYRRPTINVYNNVYVSNNSRRVNNYYRRGDDWRPHARRTVSLRDEQVTRTRYYPNSSRDSGAASPAVTRTTRRSPATRSEIAKLEAAGNERRSERQTSRTKRQPAAITFKPRPETSGSVTRTSVTRPAQARTPTSTAATPRAGATGRPDAPKSRTQRPSNRDVEPRLSQVRPQTRATLPQSSQPRASKPQASTPRTSQPRPSQPKAAQPRAVQPRVSQPRVSQPRVSQPSASKPRLSTARPAPARSPAAAPRSRAEPRAARPAPARASSSPQQAAPERKASASSKRDDKRTRTRRQ